MKLPTGPSAPAADGAAVLDQATRACRGARSLTTEVAVSGSVAGRRVRVRLSAGVSAPASARLEAVAPFGSPLFIFVANGADATLLLPRDDRVLAHGRPDAVLEALTGVPLGAADLRETMTGCASDVAGVRDAQQFGEDWRMVRAAGGGELYLHRERANAPWRLVAAIRRADSGRTWRGEFGDFQNDLPRTVRVTSVGGNAFDLQLALSQVDVNVPLDPAVFTVQVPASASPMTLDELRQSGPLSGSSRSDGR